LHHITASGRDGDEHRRSRSSKERAPAAAEIARELRAVTSGIEGFGAYAGRQSKSDSSSDGRRRDALHAIVRVTSGTRSFRARYPPTYGAGGHFASANYAHGNAHTRANQ